MDGSEGELNVPGSWPIHLFCMVEGSRDTALNFFFCQALSNSNLPKEKTRWNQTLSHPPPSCSNIQRRLSLYLQHFSSILYRNRDCTNLWIAYHHLWWAIACPNAKYLNTRMVSERKKNAQLNHYNFIWFPHSTKNVVNKLQQWHLWVNWRTSSCSPACLGRPESPSPRGRCCRGRCRHNWGYARIAPFFILYAEQKTSNCFQVFVGGRDQSKGK